METKRIHIGKEVREPLFVGDIGTVHKQKIPNQLAFSKVAGYKMNTQKIIKSVVFLYTSDKSTEEEIRETIAFTVA